jgi:hypothetical protein
MLPSHVWKGRSTLFWVQTDSEALCFIFGLNESNRRLESSVVGQAQALLLLGKVSVNQAWSCLLVRFYISLYICAPAVV